MSLKSCKKEMNGNLRIKQVWFMFLEKKFFVKHNTVLDKFRSTVGNTTYDRYKITKCCILSQCRNNSCFINIIC